jgi:hypothetical protein
VTEPEDAMVKAREALAAMRAQGAYSEREAFGVGVPIPGDTRRKLLEWALVEPDLSLVRSTRRFGAPITAFKRLLVRLVFQYRAELMANQARFNLALLAYIDRLEHRIGELERAQGHEPEPRDPPPDL